MRILLLFIFLITSNSYKYSPNYYNFQKFKQVRTNEPLIFKKINHSYTEIISYAKQFDIDTTQYMSDIKKQIYDIYMKSKKRYLININTLYLPNDNSRLIPDYTIINKLNNLYDSGNEIHYWIKAYPSYYHEDVTLKQLELWEVKYNSLYVGKPDFDYIVDNNSIQINDI
tara:strand:+ start:127 stop:636 length:510 start_codon:yes stop_codon:yes gene_type:complete